MRFTCFKEIESKLIMNLHELPKIKGNKKKSKIIGRGRGSGVGAHTVGKGQKGQKSRASRGAPFGFEGGQVPLFRRLPQIGGFRNPRPLRITSVSLGFFSTFDEGLTVTPQSLVDAGFIDRIPLHGVKVLGTGKLTKKLSFEGFLFSEGAKKKIIASGSKIVENL